MYIVQCIDYIGYRIFRLDRSEKTHPIDPLNTNKYRRNGGGVLIAINASLQIESKVIHINCSAELLAIELILPNKTKIIVTTCYRVGTLGTSNCSEILNTLGKLSRKKMLRKFIIVSDFNLNGIDWGSGYTRSSIEREFLNGFADLGLIQNINVATNKKGNILDILLTTSTSVGRSPLPTQPNFLVFGKYYICDAYVRICVLSNANFNVPYLSL